MELAWIKVALDLLKEIRSTIARRPQTSDELLGLAKFLKLYGSATKLEGLANKLRSTLANGVPDSWSEHRDIARAMIKEINEFFGNLTEADIYALDIFNPTLANHLRYIINTDGDISASLDALDGSLVRGFIIIPMMFGNDRKSYRHSKLLATVATDDIKKVDLSDLGEQLQAFALELSRFREYLAETLREHWDFDALVGGSPK